MDNYPNDLDNQNTRNYAFDSIGNGIQDNFLGTSDITWTVYGKPKQGSGQGYAQKFSYDASNNRILKETLFGSMGNKQYYIRDAQGNVLAIYQ